ncbi:hypothetical protein PENTCL1PPCAC_26222 [Pristionchus entomophagus]|uniref:AAA+ ATPase domain-containing protein n=1 Tax=Pristionchus entomophagus TaxID=358040 RepID=A0AAV5UCC1_9BILA|nr:hypothetical protein PENTCL1PPCAC_26222 [Pristionchus entomophagus]
MNNFFNKKTAASSEGKTSAVKKSHEHEPWVEKYRPKRVDQIVFQSEVVSVLQKVLEGADLPNILFYGPPGTGKTTAALALCRQMFKTTEVFKDRVLEMNASDERGIQIVRTRIKDFAHRAVGGSSIGGIAAGLKVIILDEADAMTSAAQAALRRTMEKYSKNTRFFLICNYVSRIIDPLTSRCAKFRFKPLPIDCQVERLELICETEGVTAEREALEKLVRESEGDLRKSITTLQAVAAGTKRVTLDDLSTTGGRIPEASVEGYMEAIKSLSDNKILAGVEIFRREGFSVDQLLHQLYEKLVKDECFTDNQKAVIFEKIAVAEYRLKDGGSEQLQLLNVTYCLLDQFKAVSVN